MRLKPPDSDSAQSVDLAWFQGATFLTQSPRNSLEEGEIVDLGVYMTSLGKRKWILALSCVAVLTGCDSSQPQPQSTPPPAKPHYQRFVPIPAGGFFIQGVPWHGFFALDTKTGTLCKTMKQDFSGSGQWANDVPSCSQVLAANPD